MGDSDLKIGCNKAKTAVFRPKVDVREDRKRVTGGHAVPNHGKAPREVLLDH